MTVQEKFTYDKHREAREVFRTEEDKHPGVARLYKQGDVLLGGPIWLIDFPANREFLEFRHTPRETRRMFARRGWKTIVAFQTRNPIHRSHEYIQKVALEIVDGLLLHPLVGETQADDIPADVRMASYQAIAARLLPARPRAARRVSRRRCAMPARARRSFTRCAARTMAARTSSSGAITRAWASIMAPTTRRKSLTSSSRKKSASRR